MDCSRNKLKPFGGKELQDRTRKQEAGVQIRAAYGLNRPFADWPATAAQTRQ